LLYLALMKAISWSWTSALVAAALSSGCNDVVADQRGIWEVKKPARYVMASCHTGMLQTCERYAVENGALVALEGSVAGGGWEAESTQNRDDPVEQRFREIANDHCRKTKLVFDKKYGFAKSYFASCGEEGSGFEVSCFVPDTVDLRACDE
jgi:hypothetical protein